MSTKIQIEEIYTIISSKISVSKSELNENSKSSDFYKWDSLAQLNIILEIFVISSLLAIDLAN